MMDANVDESDSQGDKTSGNRQKLTDEDIVSHSLVFLLAGFETTSNTLGYTSYLLALNTEVQEKLQAEIDAYFEDKPVSYHLLACHDSPHDPDQLLLLTGGQPVPSYSRPAILRYGSARVLAASS